MTEAEAVFESMQRVTMTFEFSDEETKVMAGLAADKGMTLEDFVIYIIEWLYEREKSAAVGNKLP